MEGKILITGSKGFVGRALMKRMFQLGLLPVAFTGDITDSSDLQAIDFSGIMHCIHLAALTSVPDSWKKPHAFYRVNTGGTLRVLEACRIHGISLTYVSSYMYGEPKYLPIDEEHKTSVNNPYAHSKLLAESLCRFYAEKFDVKVQVLRPFNLYGPGQKDSFLIPQVIRQAKNEGCIHVMDLEPRRDYLYIDDFCEALLKVMNSQHSFAIYNIGSGCSFSVKEVIDVIQALLGTNKEIHTDQVRRKNEILNIAANCEKLKHEYDWRPLVNFKRGLKNTIEAMEERK